jgi:hypothetical protein
MGLENITSAKKLLEENIECLDDNEEHCGFADLIHNAVNSALFFGGAIVTGVAIYAGYELISSFYK